MLKTDGWVDICSLKCLHDPSFMALALIVFEKMNLMRKPNKNLPSQGTVNVGQGSVLTGALNCTHQDDPSFMALALIVADK